FYRVCDIIKSHKKRLTFPV
ncbi:hypothetical protein A5886_002947, partial [Enterococcus sp. 8G7_MSG3316]